MSDASDRKRDRELGMDRRISRRQFLDGVAVGVGGTLIAGAVAGGTAELLTRRGGETSSKAASLETPPWAPYPPELSGMRGSTDAAYVVPHELRDGVFWRGQAEPTDTGESYDLVVVGAGISGLSAAYLYGRDNPNARILVLDNNDDFGGHARRNEFTPVVGGYGRLIIGYGGTQSIDHPKTGYSPQASAVLREIGLKVDRFTKYYDSGFYEKLGLVNRATFFDRETWGSDYLAIRTPEMSFSDSLKDSPMSEQAKRDLAMLIEHPSDWLPGLTQEEKFAKLSELTYPQWLTDYAKVDADAVKFLSKITGDFYGYGIYGVGAIDAWADGFEPGFGGLGLSYAKPYRLNGETEKKFWQNEPYIYHFPDGGHGVARLLMRQLIPEALPGTTMEDQVLARLDYAGLDLPDNRVRVRLGSPVVKVSNVGDPPTGVEVVYVRNGSLHQVRAGGAVMACWYSMLPYIVDGYPEEQRKAAEFMTRIPLVYASTLISNWRAFEELKIQGVDTVGPGSFWLGFSLDFPVSMGGYEHPSDPDQPILLHWSAAPALGEPGMKDPRQGCRVAREELYKMSFADMERPMRELAARTLSSAGFDPARDIQAITINRWAHGYSFEYTMPFDKAFYPDGPLPGEVAARPFGRITFANTDRSSRAYMDSAIDAAVQAVQDL